MGVEKNDTTQSQPNRTSMEEAFDAAGARQPQGGRSSSQEQSTRRTEKLNPMQLNTILRRPVARRSTAADVQAFHKALIKQMDASLDPAYRDNYHLMVFDNQNHMTALSSILVVLTTRDSQGGNHAVVFNLPVASSSSRLNNTYTTINQQTIENETVPGDTVDQTLWDKVVPFVRSQFGANVKVHYAGAMPLPTDLSPENEEAMYNVFYVATQALFTVKEMDIGRQEQPYSVTMVDQTTLTVNIENNVTPALSAVGHPIRDDLTITLRAIFGNQGQNQSNVHDSAMDLTKTSVYVDLLPAAPRQLAMNQTPPTQGFYPVAMITHLDSEINAVTPELALQGLMSTTVMARNGQWASAFMQRMGGPIGDLRDVGALGYMLRLNPDPSAQPDRINTKGDNFSSTDLLKLIGTAVYDELSYMMYIEETGELSWLHSMFLEAARGNSSAVKALLDASMTLTNGHFQQFWNGSEPIAIDNQTRVAGGYWDDGQGNKRDIRDIDTLAMLNLFGKSDMKVVQDWLDTFLRRDIPSPIRLEARNKLLRNVIRGEVKIQTYFQLITINGKFMDALAAGCAAAGLQIRQNNTFFNLTGQPNQATFDGSQFAVNSQALGGAFSFGQQPYSGWRGGQNFNRFSV